MWLRPTTLQELLELRKTYPEAKLVGGNTEVGMMTTNKLLVIYVYFLSTCQIMMIFLIS
jgi:xanthine dehydrogenase/oxidase